MTFGILTQIFSDYLSKRHGPTWRTLLKEIHNSETIPVHSIGTENRDPGLEDIRCGFAEKMQLLSLSEQLAISPSEHIHIIKTKLNSGTCYPLHNKTAIASRDKWTSNERKKAMKAKPVGSIKELDDKVRPPLPILASFILSFYSSLPCILQRKELAKDLVDRILI